MDMILTLTFSVCYEVFGFARQTGESKTVAYQLFLLLQGKYIDLGENYILVTS